jgi:hypothetical protein
VAATGPTSSFQPRPPARLAERRQLGSLELYSRVLLRRPRPSPSAPGYARHAAQTMHAVWRCETTSVTHTMQTSPTRAAACCSPPRARTPGPPAPAAGPASRTPSDRLPRGPADTASSPLGCMQLHVCAVQQAVRRRRAPHQLPRPLLLPLRRRPRLCRPLLPRVDGHAVLGDEQGGGRLLGACPGGGAAARRAGQQHGRALHCAACRLRLGRPCARAHGTAARARRRRLVPRLLLLLCPRLPALTMLPP